MIGLDCTIIMHPQVWKCSGHYDLFHDYMVDCRESKRRYRYDQVRGRWVDQGPALLCGHHRGRRQRAGRTQARALKFLSLRAKDADQLKWDGGFMTLPQVEDLSWVLGPDAKSLGTLTEPREFNLMFKTTVGDWGAKKMWPSSPKQRRGSSSISEHHGWFRVRSRSVLRRSARASQRDHPRNFTFRSRELEQMEIEFFCHPASSRSGTGTGAISASSGTPIWASRAKVAAAGTRRGGIEPLLHRHRGHRIRVSLPAGGGFRRTGRNCESRQFRPAQPQRRKLDEKTRPLQVQVGADGKPKWRGSGKDLSYRDEAPTNVMYPT